MQTSLLTGRFLVFSLAFVASATLAQAEPVSGHVKSVLGQATLVLPEGQTREIEIGTAVDAGNRIKTAADGRVVIEWMPGAYSVITPNSDIEVSSLGYSQTAMAVPHRKISLKLLNGTVFCHLQHADNSPSSFKVSTPEGVAAARGTDWCVQQSGNTAIVSTFSNIVTFTMQNGTVFGIKAGVVYSVGATQAVPLTHGEVEDFLQELKDASLKIYPADNGGYTVKYSPTDGTTGFTFTIPPTTDQTNNTPNLFDDTHGALGEQPIPSTNFTSP